MRAWILTILMVASGLAWGQEAVEQESRGELTPLGAEESATEGEEAAGIPLVSTWDFLRMLLVLGAVVACIYVIFRLLKRGGRRGLAEHDLIHLIDSRGLSGSRSLHLVQVGKSYYLVGSSDGGVSLVAEITDPESVDTVRLSVAGRASSERKTFSQLLSGLFAGSSVAGVVSGGSAGGGGAGSGFVRRQRERLRKL